MNTDPTPKTEAPPRLIAAFSRGFSMVANNLQLLIFPIAIDLLLWFGPRLRVYNLLQPSIQAYFEQMKAMNQAMLNEMLPLARDAWQGALQNFSLFSALRALPIGVPSLLGYRGPLETPFGPARILESNSLAAALLAWLVLSLLGLALGVIYFRMLSRAQGDPRPAKAGTFGWQAGQTLLLMLLLFALFATLAAPSILVVALISLFSPQLAQFFLITASILGLWLLLPLLFSPHGIFAYQLDALRAALLSYRLVRVFLPGTGMFLLLVMLISRGMDTLWLTAPGSSWMLLVGILGHAFISSGLMMASFVYYKMGMHWMEYTLNNARPPAVRL